MRQNKNNTGPRIAKTTLSSFLIAEIKARRNFSLLLQLFRNREQLFLGARDVLKQFTGSAGGFGSAKNVAHM
jgi:hypothetical protein